ncbi:hypothetical protein BDZ89DRAFT_1063807 [Hymenopellis radicata]|nr:hypothetical protein BDZ89DRAFT_1063807 [Hymenopellis radicata]
MCLESTVPVIIDNTSKDSVTIDYFRLAPDGWPFPADHAPHPITCTSYKKDPTTGKFL